MEAITIKLREIGVDVICDDTSITVRSDGAYRSTSVRTNPYPGFPTDMHPQFSAVLCTSRGISSISEGIFGGNRFKYVDELKKMGADIVVVENTAHITGVHALQGASVKATDLRAGAALVIAALGAEGVSTISGTEYIDRGYQNIEHRLNALEQELQEFKR